MSRRLVVGWLGLLCCAAALYGAAPTPPEQTPWLVAEPSGPWAGDRWTLVVALGGQDDDTTQVFERFRRLTADRGALLAVPLTRTEEAIDALLRGCQARYQLVPRALLAARGDLVDLALGLLVKGPDRFLGLLAIDGAPPAEVEPAAGPPLKVVLLVTDPVRAEANGNLAGSLRRAGAACAVETVAPDELPKFLAAAMTQLLPPPPSRRELRDPVTSVHLVAPPGWEFVRHDYFFAVAQPAGGQPELRVEIATGMLGKRSFEDYVAETGRTLKVDGIEVLENARLTPEDAPSLVHAFRFVDRRGAAPLAVYWVQVGHGPVLVSFRCAAAEDQLTAHLGELRQLALSVTFDD